MVTKSKTYFGDETKTVKEKTTKATTKTEKPAKTTKRKYTRRAPTKKKTNKQDMEMVTIQVPAQLAFHLGVLLGQNASE